MTALPISGVIPLEVEGSRQPISAFPPAAEVPSLGVEGDALVDEVIAALQTLHRLTTQHADLLGEDATNAIRTTAKQVLQRLNRNELTVVVAGEPGSGKSTFLNAVIGDLRLGKARDAPVPTFLRRGAAPDFRFRFADGKRIDFAELVPDEQRKVDQQLVKAEEGFEQAESRHQALLLKAESAREAVARDEAELVRQREALNSMRETVRSLEGMLGGAEMAVQHTAERVAVVERNTPRSIVARGTQLSFWGWLLQWWFKLLYSEPWSVLAEARQQHDDAAERLRAMKQRMQETDQACVDIEDRVLSVRVSLETRTSQLGAAERVLPAAERATGEARRAMEQERTKLGRYFEERQDRYFSELARLVKSQPPPVELSLDYPADFLPDEVAILDAPGVTNENASNDVWELIRQQADGCILIADLEKGISPPTERFLERLREFVPHVLLVLSKMDAAFGEAQRRGEKEPWSAVEGARRARTQRFAEQIGRAPDSVLSIAVSALAKVEQPESELGKHFEVELRKLFRLLRHERAIILGTRAARFLKESLSRISDAEKRAEASYRERIRALEADHVPEPEGFHRQAIAKSAQGIERAAQTAVAQASELVRSRFAELRSKSGDQIRASVPEKQFKDTCIAIERNIGTEVRGVEAKALIDLEAQIEKSTSELEKRVFAELREKYRIDREVTRTRESFDRPDRLMLNRQVPARAVVRSAIRKHGFVKFVLGLSGVAAGAGIGYFLHGPLGAAIGGVVGVLLAFVKTQRSIERRAIALMELELRKEEQAVLKDVMALLPRVQKNVHSTLDQSIEDVIIRFGSYIAEPFEAGQQAIAKERTSLGQLRELGQAMVKHDARLETLMKEAATASRGLCQ